MNKPKEIEVDGRRVYVVVDEDEYGDLEAVQPDMPIMEPFKPFDRIVVNFKLVDPNKQNEPVIKFDPPIELWVQYSPQDEKEARERGQPLQLAYWNGDYWVRFKEDEHKFKLDPSGKKGYGFALVSKWADPPIAWGT